MKEIKMSKTILLAIITMVLVSGCASKQLTHEQASKIDEYKLYQLYIDEDGNLLNPASQEVVNDEQAYVDAIINNFDKLRANNEDLTLTIFIHGGLNTFDSARSKVELAKDKMLADGKYPLFISWNSGPFTNYSDHLFLLRRGINSPVFGPISSPFVLLEDILRSIARFPASTYNVLFGQNSVRINNYSKEEKAATNALDKLHGLGFQIFNSPNDTGHTFSDWATVWNPVKLISAPFLDGFGKGAWDSMLRRTDLVLRKDTGFDGESEFHSNTAVTMFFTRYIELYPKRKTVIIGHSMGTIIANNIVSKYPDINFSNIIYMAAACRLKDLEYVISPYLESNPSAIFYSLSLNPYRDISENFYLDFVPRGSLLIWIDQTLGETNSFQDRTAGFWFNIVRAAGNTFKKDTVRKRVNLTQFGINDETPQNHGDFSKFEYWSEDFWKGQVRL